jgi:hypothetical protein
MADEHLATALATWPALDAAVSAGEVNLDQARSIIGSLTLLPADLLGAHVLARAESYLVAQAAEFDPKELRNLGLHLLAVVAPDQVDEADRRKIEAEMEKARQRTRLTFRPNHDGTTSVTATVPDSVAERLKQYLDAIASPRRNPDVAAPGVDGDDGEHDGECCGEPADVAPARVGYATTDPSTGKRIPADQVRGHAFMALLEHLDPAKLPDHGGLATQVIVTIDYETLLGKVGAASLASGGRISASEARRLACTAGIIPAVMNGKSEVLDLGRAQRFYSASQRKALAILHPVCQGEGCQVPASQSEFHHGGDPWSRGGRTDLADGMVLCPWHHHRIHDPGYDHERLPNGDVRFHRRR